MSTFHTHVVGLTGPINCGKDTVGALLAKHAGAHTMAFADPLRIEIVDAFCIEQVFLTRRETKERPMDALALSRCTDKSFVDRMVITQGVINMDDFLNAPRSPREIMRWWGTEYRRANDPAYWVNLAAQRLRWFHTGLAARLVVITDVRAENEAQLVRGVGGHVWQITRPGHQAKPAEHSSEVTGEAFAPNAVIDNAGDLRDLQERVLSEWAAIDWRIPGVRVGVPA